MTIFTLDLDSITRLMVAQNTNRTLAITVVATAIVKNDPELTELELVGHVLRYASIAASEMYACGELPVMRKTTDAEIAEVARKLSNRWRRRSIRSVR